MFHPISLTLIFNALCSLASPTRSAPLLLSSAPLNVFIPIVRCRRRRRRRLTFDTNCLNTSRVDLMLLLFHFDRCGDYTDAFFVRPRRVLLYTGAPQPIAACAAMEHK
jgi:hypothetical protein